jgi:isovaleryl-CoA dehydrogenase
MNLQKVLLKARQPRHHAGKFFLSSSSSSFQDFWNPTPEHLALRNSLRSFCQKEVEPQALEYNRNEKFNIDLFRKLGTELGILGLTVPEKYGGTELDATAVALVHEELSYSDPAFCLSYLAHSLLLVNNMAVNANPTQCEQLLPALCDGSQIGGMCMSESAAGTDVLGMRTSAKLDGSDASWILNGTKMWITNGTLDGQDTGDVFLVYAKSGPKRTDITQFIVTKDMEGFSLGQQIKDKLGMRASYVKSFYIQCFSFHYRSNDVTFSMPQQYCRAGL